MKFTAKHPNGPAYDLTPEEMEDPAVVRKLGIDDSWLVLVGTEWISITRFLAKPAAERAVPPAPPAAKPEAVSLSANAPLTPGTLFALALRLAGAYLLLQVTLSVVGLASQMITQRHLPAQFMEQFWIQAVVLQAGPALVGIYLITGPRALINWVFKDSDD